jgi:AcrR family transcriptional regulator
MSSISGERKAKTDRRARRTRHRLGAAIVELVKEKPFETITVQDVLDRAGVGRSTFYAHYRGKNDLFLSDADEFFGAIATMLSRNDDPSDRVAPVREFFAHVAEERRLIEALVASGWFHEFMDLAQGHFSRGIAQRLSELERGRGITRERRKVLTHGLAGALVSLLSFWLEGRTKLSAAEMDDLYHRMVWAGIDSVPEGDGRSGRARPR